MKRCNGSYRRFRMVMFFALTVSPLLVQNPLFPQVPVRDFSRYTDHPEELRNDLLRLTGVLHRLSQAGGSERDQLRVANLRLDVQNAGPASLSFLARVLDGAKFQYALSRLELAIASASASGLPYSKGLALPRVELSPIEPPEYPVRCTSTRSDAEVFFNLWLVWRELENLAIQARAGCGADPTGVSCAAQLLADTVAFTLKFELDFAAFCDSAIDSAEIEAGWENSVVIHDDLASHHDAISAQLAKHDEDIKAILSNIQSMQRQIVRLLLTPEGRREVDPAVINCLGDQCPQVLDCPGEECEFPIPSASSKATQTGTGR